MPRHTILGQRPSDGQFGIFVAKPGLEANGPESDLWFSMSRAQGQVIAYGFIFIPGTGAAQTIWFPRTLPKRPFVYCGEDRANNPKLRVRVDVQFDRALAYYAPRGGSSAGFWAQYLVVAAKDYY